MDCPICGKETVWGSKFCQKCGGRIDDIGIRRSDIIKVLSPKIEKAEISASECGNAKNVIEKIQTCQMRKVRLIHSSLEEMDFSELVTEENGVLNIICDGEMFIRLGAVFVVNEIDSLHNEILELSTKIHDDRISHIEAAFRQYKRALRTADMKRKEQVLDLAAHECILGLSMIKKEIQRHLDYFEQVPRGTLAKLFRGTNVGQIEEELAQCQEAFTSYCGGVRILIEADSICGESERVQGTIGEETEFLKSLSSLEGYKRLLEIDDTNVGKWRDMVNNLEIDMYHVRNCIEEKETVIRLD